MRKRDIMCFLDRINLSQINTLCRRYNIRPICINPRKKRAIYSQSLMRYWRKHEQECAICLEAIHFDITVATQCTHLFCDLCLMQHLRKSDTCPVCRDGCDYVGIITQIPEERLLQIDKRVIENIQEDYEDMPSRYIVSEFAIAGLGCAMFFVNISAISFVIFICVGISNSYSLFNDPTPELPLW